MQRSLPPSLFATGRTIRHLRTEIEGATGCVLEFPRRADATGAVWGRDAVAARVLAGINRPAVVVEAGPRKFTKANFPNFDPAYQARLNRGC